MVQRRPPQSGFRPALRALLADGAWHDLAELDARLGSALPMEMGLRWGHIILRRRLRQGHALADSSLETLERRGRHDWIVQACRVLGAERRGPRGMPSFRLLPQVTPARITQDEAMALLGVTGHRLVQMLRRGELPYQRQGKLRILLRADVEAYLRQQNAASPPAPMRALVGVA